MDPTVSKGSVVEPDSPKYRVPKLDKSEGSTEGWEVEIRKLQEENKQLQLRILGVNELARLLQDRNEIVEVLQEKNKRLEVAVVRLENRCSNFERKLKSQGGVMVGPKPGQSPFIPGPSRQILEALMKENSELKKTLNKKVPVGYLEAVKTTQLEEVIEQQKQELDFLKAQIQSLTSSSLSEEEKSSGESSLTSVGSLSDTGPLKRQVIKLQHAMKVKDRFCTLLSQQVAELQHKLSSAPKETIDIGEIQSTPSEPSSTSGQPVQESSEQSDPPSVPERPTVDLPPTHQEIRELKNQLMNQKEELEGRYKHLIEDQKDTIQRERDEKESLVYKLQSVEQQLKREKSELESLQQRYEGLVAYNQTLVEEKTHLTRMLSQSQQKSEGPQAKDPSEESEKRSRELQKTLEEQVGRHSEEVQQKDKEISQLNTLLEDTQYRLAIAESKLETAENEKLQAVSNLKEQIDELDIELSALRNEKQELLRDNRDKAVQIGHLKTRPGGYTHAPYYRSPASYSGSPNTVGRHCAPNLQLAGLQVMMDSVADRPNSTRPRPNTGPQQSVPHLDPTMVGRSFTQQHCLPGQADYLAHRQEVPVGYTGRGVPDKPPGHLDLNVPQPSSQQHRRTPSPTHMANQMQFGRTPTTPLDPHQVNRGLSPGPQDVRSISPTYTTSTHIRPQGGLTYSPVHRSQYPGATNTTPSPAQGTRPFAPVPGSIPQSYSVETRRATYPIVSHYAPTSQVGYSSPPAMPGHPQTQYQTQGSRESGYSSINSEGYFSGRLQSQISPSYDPHHQRQHPQGQDESSSAAAKDYNYQQ